MLRLRGELILGGIGDGYGESSKLHDIIRRRGRIFSTRRFFLNDFRVSMR